MVKKNITKHYDKLANGKKYEEAIPIKNEHEHEQIATEIF